MEQAYAAERKKTRQQDRREKQHRLTAAVHVVNSHFLQHEKVEGLVEQENSPRFLGCDRLLKLESSYGKVQLGYDPQKGVSFLFMHLKQNIYDTVSSAHQRQLQTQSKAAQMKIEGTSRAYTAKRREKSSVIVYKSANKPWTESAIKPYLRNEDMESMERVMPFLNVTENKRRLQGLYDRQRQEKQQEQKGKRQIGSVQDIWRDIEAENVLIWRKEQQSRLFFRKINQAFDRQKQEMFIYYRDKQKKMAQEAENAQPNVVLPDGDDNGDLL